MVEEEMEKEALQSLQRTGDYSQDHIFQKEVFNCMLDLTRQQSVIIETLTGMVLDLKAVNEKLDNAGK
jgi:hypothetical protein